jgi:hypothetical protein
MLPSRSPSSSSRRCAQARACKAAAAASLAALTTTASCGASAATRNASPSIVVVAFACSSVDAARSSTRFVASRANRPSLVASIAMPRCTTAARTLASCRIGLSPTPSVDVAPAAAMSLRSPSSTSTTFAKTPITEIIIIIINKSITSNNRVSSLLLLLLFVPPLVDGDEEELNTLSTIAAARCRALLKIGSSALRTACRQCIRHTNASFSVFVLLLLLFVGHIAIDTFSVLRPNSLLFS